MTEKLLTIMLTGLLLQATAPSDWVLFFGHFHPLVVHLPIGFLLIAGVLELGQRLGKITVSDGVISTVLLGSAVGATVACVFGYLLSLGGGYEAEILEEHQWQGIGVSVFAWIAWAMKSETLGDRIPFGSLLYGPVLLASLLLVGAAGHHGGSLTHGSDYLTQYTPEPFRSLAGLPPKRATVATKPITDVNQAVVYEQIINPILNQSCVQCHNAEKSKGGLRYDTAELLKKGGKNGPVYVAGKGMDSEMIKRCLLPVEDEHHMPPKGKTPLTDPQIALLTWWIDQGAPFDKKVADLTVTETVKPALATLGGVKAVGGGVAVALSATSTGGSALVVNRPESPVLTMTIPAGDAQTISALQKAGLLVLPVAKEQHQLEVSAVNAPNFGDAQAGLLAKLNQQIIWLKLGDTNITDAAITQVALLKNLQKLHMERTHITDAGLKQLRTLPYLEYLNLYGTAITDAGLAELAGLKSLRTVYVWQTKTTPAGLANLKKALPDVDIIGGIDESAVATFTKAEK